MPRIADEPPSCLDDWTWRRVVADGHLHRAAPDCPHRPPLEACRVCCPHPEIAEPVQVDPLAPDDQADDCWSPRLAVLCAAVAFAAFVAVFYGAVHLCLWIGAR